MDQWLEVLKSFGAPVAVAVFFMIRLRVQDVETREREARMAKRLDEQQDKFVEVIEKSNEAHTRHAETLRDLVEELRRRPCMSSPNWDGADRRK